MLNAIYQKSVGIETMELTVRMGEITVTKPPYLLKTTGIGSCIAVTLYDRETTMGSLAHIMLPCAEDALGDSPATAFADAAIEMMIERMKRNGASLRNAEAKIFGGANMFPKVIPYDSAVDVGMRNISAVRNELTRHGIDIVAEEVGAFVGRTVLFDTCDGSVIVKTTHAEEGRMY